MRYLKKAVSIVSLALVLSLLTSSLAWAAKPPKKAAGKGNNKASVTTTKKEEKAKGKEAKAIEKMAEKEAKKKAKEETKEQRREEKQVKAQEKAEAKLQKKMKKQDWLIELNNEYLQANENEQAVEILEQLCALEPSRGRFKDLKTLYKALQKERPLTPELFVNGEYYQEKVKPIVRYGRTLVPLRALAARLKAEVAYDDETKTITMVRDGYTAAMGLENNQVTISDANGNTVKEVELDVTPLLDNNSTFVPLRALAEIFGANVTYDDDTNIIVIEDPDDEDDIKDDEELPEDDEDEDENDLDDVDEELEDDEDLDEDQEDDLEDELDDADEEAGDTKDDDNDDEPEDEEKL